MRDKILIEVNKQSDVVGPHNEGQHMIDLNRLSNILMEFELPIIEKYTKNKVVIEKPVIPSFVADWLNDRRKNGFSNVDIIEQIYSIDYMDNLEVNTADAPLKKYLNSSNENKEKIVKAVIINNYEVEEEPLYRARLKVITDEFIASYLRTQSSSSNIEDRLTSLEIGNKFIHEDYRHLSEFTEDELKRLDIWDSEQWEVEELEE